jgi:hypothetical protein
MSPVPKERVEEVRAAIRAVLAGKASDIFLGRIDAILAEWSSGKITAAQACEKAQKIVSLFLGEDLAKEIGNRCSPIVMRESSGM